MELVTILRKRKERKMHEHDLSFKLSTLFEQLRFQGKSKSGDIHLSLEQQEEIVKKVKELEDYTWYLFEKYVELDNDNR